MWAYEHGIETTAAPQAIWRLWADIENWGAWDAAIEKIEVHGPFAAGTEFTMTPPGPAVRMRIAEAIENERFVDETRMEGLILRAIHRIDRLDQGIRVVHRMEITGPGADEVGPRLGPGITADWPETMASLVRLAQAGCH